MSEDRTEQDNRPNDVGKSVRGDYLRGLHASVRNNASAYGFSVTITASFGLLTSALGTPTALEIFAFAGGAVAAFALVEFVVSGGYKHELTDEPSDVKNVGSSVSVLSVGAAMACAYAAGRLLGGFVAWPAGSFVATSIYVFLFGVELAFIAYLRRRGSPKGLVVEVGARIVFARGSRTFLLRGSPSTGPSRALRRPV